MLRRIICKVLGRHRYIITDGIISGSFKVECPYCGCTLFEHKEEE